MNNLPDLYALIIRLTAVTSGTLRATQGHQAHAAFLDILRYADPALVQTLHDHNGRQPFTLSPLQGFGQGLNGRLPIHAGQNGWLRLTLLDPALFQTFIGTFLHRATSHPTLTLESVPFAITELLTTPTSHSQAGTANLAQLTTHWQTLPLTSAHTSIALEFLTPTAFSRKNSPHRHMLLLPDPPTIFGQLATYWDALTGQETTEQTRAFAQEHLAVSRYNLQTHALQFPKNTQIGFVGQATFQILEKQNETLIRHLNCLADLAFFTGLGYKTTMGMGQVTRIKS